MRIFPQSIHKDALFWPSQAPQWWFNFSLTLGRVKFRITISVYLSVCLSVPLQNTHFKVSWRLLVEECVPYMGLWLHTFSNKGDFLFGGGVIFFWDCYNVQFCTSLPLIMGELGGEGLLLWLLTVCCWHFNVTSITLQWNFNGALTAH